MDNTKLVHNFLENSSEKFSEKNAVHYANIWYTYSQINLETNQLAHFLIDIGVKKGQRVAILLENSIEYIITYYAILKAGATTVALNTENTIDDIGFILHDCDVQVLITNLKFLKNIKTQFDNDTLIKNILVWNKIASKELPKESKKINYLPKSFDSYSTENTQVRLIDLDLASIVYTSGSTGKPRGVTLSHLNIVTNTRSIVDYLKLSQDDRVMTVLPFHYIYGKSLLNTHFFVGGSVVIDNRFLYPNVVLKNMYDQEVTGFSGVPSTFNILLNRSNVRSYKFKTLRYITQAGGAMAPAIQKEVSKIFDPAQLYIMYGATEASARLSYLDPKDLSKKWGSIGKAIPNVELFIADDQGNPLRPGEEGEIVARGTNLMKGYWNDPKETAKVLKHGLYYTGDIGVMDKEGFLFVVGRSKDMIKVGGNRLSAKEIEEVLYEHPDISEAAVIGVNDDILGEAIKAFVVLKNGSVEANRDDEILSFLKKHLAPYKLPKYIEYRDSLPKNESGKIQKLKLK